MPPPTSSRGGALRRTRWEGRTSPLRKLYRRGGDRHQMKRHVTFLLTVGGARSFYNRFAFLHPPFLCTNQLLRWAGERRIYNQSRPEKTVEWGVEAGPAASPTPRGKWAGPPREPRRLTGGDKVNGAAGSVEQSGSTRAARVRGPARFPTGPRLEFQARASASPTWGSPLSFCPRLVGSPRRASTPAGGSRAGGLEMY